MKSISVITSTMNRADYLERVYLSLLNQNFDDFEWIVGNDGSTDSTIEILKNLKKRKNYNQKLLKRFKEVQLPISYKKKKSNFIIKNDFTKRSVNDGIKLILKEIE